MSNIVIYLPYEPMGKQGGMERATHGLAEMLRDAGHRVLLLCREKNRLGETYFAPVPLAFLPSGLSRSGERDYLLKLLREEKTDVLIDQTEGGVTGRWGIFRTRTQMEEAPVKLVAVQHSSQYSACVVPSCPQAPGRRLLPENAGTSCSTHWRSRQAAPGAAAAKKPVSGTGGQYDRIVTLSRSGMENSAAGSRHACGKLAAIPAPSLTIEAPPLPAGKGTTRPLRRQAEQLRQGHWTDC